MIWPLQQHYASTAEQVSKK